MDPVPALDAVAKKIAPGRTPTYTSAQVLKVLELIANASIGRQQLADKLGIGEGSIRTIVKRLISEGLISTTRNGMYLTKKGERLLTDLHSRITGIELKLTGVTVGKSDYAILVKGASHCVRKGVEQRDSALLAGAKGATTIIFELGQLRIPGIETALDEQLVKELKTVFTPMEGDVVIIGTADDNIDAEIGAKASALEILRLCR